MFLGLAKPQRSHNIKLTWNFGMGNNHLFSSSHVVSPLVMLVVLLSLIPFCHWPHATKSYIYFYYLAILIESQSYQMHYCVVFINNWFILVMVLLLISCIC